MTATILQMAQLFPYEANLKTDICHCGSRHVDVHQFLNTD